MPRGELYKAFRNRRIKINGKRAAPDYRIVSGDIIDLYINDEYFTETESARYDSAGQLNILYEDDNLIMAVKPAGLLCHSDNKNEPNLIDTIIKYLIDSNVFQPEKENSFTPALCNRIDQGTEGIVIAAKNYASLRDMNRIIADDLVEKRYLFISEGHIDDGIYNAFLTRDRTNKKVSVSLLETDGSHPIKTEFRLIGSRSGYYLYECVLHTGRTHQIRAHSAFLGRPVLGDRKYGSPNKSFKSQLLCAYSVSFRHVPEDRTLSYLSDRTFRYDDNNVVKTYKSL